MSGLLERGWRDIGEEFQKLGMWLEGRVGWSSGALI